MSNEPMERLESKDGLEAAIRLSYLALECNAKHTAGGTMFLYIGLFMHQYAMLGLDEPASSRIDVSKPCKNVVNITVWLGPDVSGHA